MMNAQRRCDTLLSSCSCSTLSIDSVRILSAPLLKAHSQRPPAAPDWRLLRGSVGNGGERSLSVHSAVAASSRLAQHDSTHRDVGLGTTAVWGVTAPISTHEAVSSVASIRKRISQSQRADRPLPRTSVDSSRGLT